MIDRYIAWATALIADSKNESGQTFVEYALVLSVIVVGVLLAATWGGLTGSDPGRHHRGRHLVLRNARRRSHWSGPPTQRPQARPPRPSSQCRSKHTQHQHSRIRRDDGQAFVEFAIVLPMLVLLVFGITQFGMAFRNYLAITDAARVGARAAAVKRTSSPCTAARTAIQNTVSAGQWAQITSRITCSAGPNVGDQIKITIKYPYKIGLPGVKKSGDLTANTTERLE